MPNVIFEKTSKAIRRAFFGSVDRALAKTVKEILGDAACTRDEWEEVLRQLERECKRVEVIRAERDIDKRVRSKNVDITVETEVMRYEIWVDGRVVREVVMTYQSEPPKFFVRTSTAGD
jgi:hypothetical protein